MKKLFHTQILGIMALLGVSICLCGCLESVNPLKLLDSDKSGSSSTRRSNENDIKALVKDTNNALNKLDSYLLSQKSKTEKDERELADLRSELVRLRDQLNNAAGSSSAYPSYGDYGTASTSTSQPYDSSSYGRKDPYDSYSSSSTPGSEILDPRRNTLSGPSSSSSATSSNPLNNYPSAARSSSTGSSTTAPPPFARSNTGSSTSPLSSPSTTSRSYEPLPSSRTTNNYSKYSSPATASSGRGYSKYREKTGGVIGSVLQVKTNEILLDRGTKKGLRTGNLIAVKSVDGKDSVWRIKKIDDFVSWAEPVSDSPSRYATSQATFYQVDENR